MLIFTKSLRVCLEVEPCDLRASFEKLAVLVKERLGEDERSSVSVSPVHVDGGANWAGFLAGVRQSDNGGEGIETPQGRGRSCSPRRLCPNWCLRFRAPPPAPGSFLTPRACGPHAAAAAHHFGSCLAFVASAQSHPLLRRGRGGCAAVKASSP